MSGRERKHRPLRHVRLVQLTRPAEPSVPEPQREKPPAESLDPTPGQKREEDQGGAKIRMPHLKADLQKLSQSKTGGECGDGRDVQGKSVPKSEEFKMPEGAEEKPQV
ncbi:X antigen family member 5-like [Sapajus apella]|uniref:X antigen family member 5-like n=1 Tax=Sapajus apella TaxID=9515 RepID=A0A6J3HDQ2_SAPAP|nr:X antigen family member 5-like [Sapajus apella]